MKKKVLLSAVMAGVVLSGCSSEKDTAQSLVGEYLSLKDPQECVEWMKEKAVVLDAHPNWDSLELEDADDYVDIISKICQGTSSPFPENSEKYLLSHRKFGKHSWKVSYLVVSPDGKPTLYTFYAMETTPSVEKKIAQILGTPSEQIPKGKLRFAVVPVRQGWKYVDSPYETFSLKKYGDARYVLARMIAMGKCEDTLRIFGTEDLKKNAGKYCQKLYEWTGEPLSEKDVVEKAETNDFGLVVEYPKEEEAPTFRGKKVKADYWNISNLSLTENEKKVENLMVSRRIEFQDGSEWNPPPRKRTIPNTNITYDESTMIIPGDVR